MKQSSIILTFLLSLHLVYGQNISGIGKIFFDIPIDSNFQYLCNNTPKNTDLFIIKEYQKGTLKRENYNITFFNCNGFNLIVKDTLFYNSRHIEFVLGQAEIWKNEYITTDSEDTVVWKGATFSLILKYNQLNKKLAYSDFEKLIALTDEAGFDLKKIKYGKGLGIQWDENTKELKKENAAKVWKTSTGKRAYLSNNIYPYYRNRT